VLLAFSLLAAATSHKAQRRSAFETCNPSIPRSVLLVNATAMVEKYSESGQTLEDEKASKAFEEFAPRSTTTHELSEAEAGEFRKKEAKLNKKLDVFIAPVMMLCMLVSYLDRRCVVFTPNLPEMKTKAKTLLAISGSRLPRA
jgi:hypothetical protein